MKERINNYRLHNVDALRGFALVSIMLLHNLEHFDFYFKPENLPHWMVSLDQLIWDSTFFLFAGKSYAIFAFLFGVTFCIQTNNQGKKGNDFRGRFAWRLVLLSIFGFINSAIFEGDILSIYAFVGFFLIPFVHLNSKTIVVIALILLLQPLELVHLFTAMQHPEMTVSNPESWTYFGKMGEYVKGNSLIDTIIGNLTNGKKAVWLWSWENGRFFHILALFMFGMLAGRKDVFTRNALNKKRWLQTLIISSIAFIPLFYIQKYIIGTIESKAIKMSLKTIETSYTNIAFTLILIAGFVLLFQTKTFNKILSVFSSMGKMSLTNYILQSIIGATIYYGFGFGLYQYTGATYSLLIGIICSVCLIVFSSWWLKNHKRGPLEQLWHHLTWISFFKNC